MFFDSDIVSVIELEFIPSERNPEIGGPTLFGSTRNASCPYGESTTWWVVLMFDSLKECASSSDATLGKCQSPVKDINRTSPVNAEIASESDSYPEDKS